MPLCSGKKWKQKWQKSFQEIQESFVAYVQLEAIVLQLCKTMRNVKLRRSLTQKSWNTR